MTGERRSVPIPRPETGDIQFAAPWEATAFAMTVRLSEAGLFTWNEWVAQFSSRLEEKPDTEYYRVWLDALEDLLSTLDLVDQNALRERLQHLIDNPPPHEHVARREPIVIA